MRCVPGQAQAAQFAAVWLWRTADWTPTGQPLEAHSLTVTQMAFSSTGQHLLTVSRDRTFAVWERQTAGKLACTVSDCGVRFSWFSPLSLTTLSCFAATSYGVPSRLLEVP